MGLPDARRLLRVDRHVPPLPRQVKPLLRPLLNGDERVLLVVVRLEHLPEALVVALLLLKLVLRKRGLDPEEVLENFKILRVDLLKLRLPVVVLADHEQVPRGVLEVVGRARTPQDAAA